MSTIIDQLAAAVRARKDSLVALRSRITETLKPVPVGVVLSDEQGEVCRIVGLETGASQWANQTWNVTISGWGAVSRDGKLVCECLDSSLWDGRNMHHRSSEGIYLAKRRDDDVPPLRYEPGKVTRELAARLPAAIARYMAECEAVAARNATAAAAL